MIVRRSSHLLSGILRPRSLLILFDVPVAITEERESFAPFLALAVDCRTQEVRRGSRPLMRQLSAQG